MAGKALQAPSLKDEHGYLPSLLDYLLSVRAADSIALVAAGVIFSNRTLSRIVVSQELIHFIAGILRGFGPSQKLLGLFTAMISGSRKHIARNQEMVLQVVCSASSNPVYLDNRRSVMMETQLTEGGQGEVFVWWSGSEQYIRGRHIDAELFYDPATLGLQTRLLPPPLELHEYFLRCDSRTPPRGSTASHAPWTQLSALAWYIDPEHCFFFWRTHDPSAAWRKHVEAQEAEGPAASKKFIENLEHLRSLCQHYLGVIELYTSLCCKRCVGLCTFLICTCLLVCTELNEQCLILTYYILQYPLHASRGASISLLALPLGAPLS